MTGKFPPRLIPDIGDYWSGYAAGLAAAARSLDLDRLRAAAALVEATIRADNWIYTCGNGGSAAIANHLQCDFAKGIQADTAHLPRVISLAANLETILAIGNDFAFEDVFAFQLRTAARAGDLLITVSASGNSENIVRPIQWARQNGVKTIALTGFDGGRSAALADVNLHVAGHNYGIVEDVHQSIMHTLAQFVRQTAMAPDQVSGARF
jgi:phosphoheptose isomerase